MKPSLLAAMLALPLLAPPQAGAQSIPAHEMQRVAEMILAVRRGRDRRPGLRRSH